MIKQLKTKLSSAIILAVAIALMVLPASIVSCFEDPFSEIKGKMDGISQKEREIIQELFIQDQKVREIEMQEKKIAADIETLKNEILDLQKVISDEEIAYVKNKETLKQVLLSYQRMGPGSYLEILLKSDSLSDLLTRINILRDLTRNTGMLLDEIKKSSEKQSAEKKKLSEKLLKVEEDRQRLAQALNKNKQQKADMEEYLASMAEERGRYQEHLEGFQKVWGELGIYFSKVVDEFSTITHGGSLSEEALKMSFDFFSIKVSLDETTLNDMINGNPKLQGMVWDFHQGKVEMSVPGKSLVLEGKFVIVDGHTIRFNAERGSFFGLPLEAGTIKELFKDNYLELNFKSQLAGLKMNTMEIMDGYLNITIKL